MTPSPLLRLLVACLVFALLVGALDAALRACGVSPRRRARTGWALAALLPAYVVYRMTEAGLPVAPGARLLLIALLAAGMAACERLAHAFGCARGVRVRAILAISAPLLAWIAWRSAARDAIDLLTGLVLLAAVWAFLLLLVELLPGSVGRLRPNLRLLATTVGLLLIGSELWLRFGLGRYASYSERVGPASYVRLDDLPSDRFHLHPANAEVTIVHDEFVHRRSTSSLGLSEAEIPASKPPSERRVIALGDSFTEGFGASYEESWVKVVERGLAARLPSASLRAINAGISGSDIAFTYVLLEDRLLDLQPDLVVVAINSSDVDDFIIRGGLERFRPDGSRRPGRTPRWEWLYGASHLVRALAHGALGYNSLLVGEDRMSLEVEGALAGMRTVLGAFEQLAQREGHALLVALHPSRRELESGAYGYDLRSLLERGAGARVANFDLLEELRARGYGSRQDAAALYWPIDGHHNAKGYELMGRALAEKILDARLLAAALAPEPVASPSRR